MTMQEAIEKRETLLAEERKLNHAIKVMQSDTIPSCAGVTMAIGQYRRRLREITEEIRELADNIDEQATENQHVKPFVMYGETEKDAETPKAEMPTWTGDSDIDFLVNLLKKAEVSISKHDDGDRFITLIKAILD